MHTDDPVADAVELLQQLGLTEYEARCFVALSELSTGNAKEIAAIGGVPRTRVYDSVRVLEARGLVEVQHTNPRRFRPVRITEAMETLRGQYETRVDQLTDALDRIRDGGDDDGSNLPEIWTLFGAAAIQSRVDRLIGAAVDTVFVIVGGEDRLTDDLLGAVDRADEVDVVVGVPTNGAKHRVHERAPQVQTAASAFDWLTDDVDGVAVGLVMLVDGSRALVSTVSPNGEERAVIGTADYNGLVVIVRRFIALAMDR